MHTPSPLGPHGLNHLNLPVADLGADRDFFTTFFGFRCERQQGELLAVLRDPFGFVLTLNRFKQSADFAYPPHFASFHLGFGQGSREAVDALHRRLHDAGFTPQVARLFHGAWTFYVKGPSGYTVEVFHQEGELAGK